jgi:DNA-binding NarL/FixJ family response regulator
VPHLLVMGLNLSGRSGSELIKDVLTVNPDLPILVFSSYDERVFGSRMIRAGARGFLMKHAAAQDVLAAMRRLLDGGVYASAALSSQLLV